MTESDTHAPHHTVRAFEAFDFRARRFAHVKALNLTVDVANDYNDNVANDNNDNDINDNNDQDNDDFDESIE